MDAGKGSRGEYNILRIYESITNLQILTINISAASQSPERGCDEQASMTASVLCGETAARQNICNFVGIKYMAKNLDPKCKQCRREGEKLMLKGDRCNSPKCAMVKKNYPPGAHGAHGGSRRPRQSDYSIQLREKQKVKKIYNVLEKQFRITFEKAKKQKGDAGENLLKMLETRLDNTVYLLGFADSRGHARQLINHGHFTVSGKKINIPSYQVEPGDIIKIKKNSVKVKAFSNLGEKFKKQEAPGWLNIDIKDLAGKVLHQPKKGDLNMKINTQMIVEFYSR